MRIFDKYDVERNKEDCDLVNGYLREEVIIRPDALPVDNMTKFAWADEDYETIQRYVQIPQERQTAERIAWLKGQLSATDYAVIKIAEGAATPEEYADVIAQRRAWRAEINSLKG